MNRAKTIIILLLFAGLLTFAQDTKTVICKGYGTTPKLATENALVQAVREAVGALVDEETLIKNDELIEEKILTFSNGIVQEYKVLKEAKQNKQGLFEVSIKAVVKSNLLKTKLEENKVIGAKVDNASEIYRNTMAQIVTESQRNKDAQKVLYKMLDSIQPERYIKLTPFDLENPENINENAKLTIIPNKEKKEATVAVGLKLEIDWDKYFSELFPYLQQTLDAISEKKKTNMVFSTYANSNTLLCFSELRRYKPRGYEPKYFFDSKEDAIDVFLQTSKRKTSNYQMTCSIYHIPYDGKDKSEVLPKPIDLSLFFQLFDNDGELIISKKVLPTSRGSNEDYVLYENYKDTLDYIKNDKYLSKRGNFTEFINYIYLYDKPDKGSGINGFVFLGPRNGYSGLSTRISKYEYNIVYKFKVSLDDIKDIARYEFKISRDK